MQRLFDAASHAPLAFTHVLRCDEQSSTGHRIEETLRAVRVRRTVRASAEKGDSLVGVRLGE